MINDDLRLACSRAIKNYMHNELIEMSCDTSMLPFFDQQAESILLAIDRAIFNTKESQYWAELIKK